MAKLAKNVYFTSKGERKLNSYLCHIPKDVAEKANITGNDEIKVYAEKNKIVIVKKDVN